MTWHALVPINRPTRENVAVGMILYDYKVDILTLKGLMSSAFLYGGFLNISGMPDHGMAMNLLFHAFLKTDFEWLVTIDNDIGFHSYDMKTLLKEGVDGGPPDLAVIGVYAKKSESFPVEVCSNGFGFARIHRTVLERIKEQTPFTFLHLGEELQDYCPSGVTPNKQIYRSDSGFWRLCEFIGVDPVFETRVNLQHVGRRVFEL